MNKSIQCPFCNPAVLKKQKLYENESVYVIYNIRPANKGQCLVVPKRHVNNIKQLNDQELAAIIQTVKLVSSKFEKHLKPTGFNYGFNEGLYSGQTVEHFHIHIMPRQEGDNLPEYHLFHRDPKTKRNLSDDEIVPFVKEFKKLFED